MKSSDKEEWNIFFHPLFNDAYVSLRDKVVSLKSKLSQDKYASHPDVKLYANIVNIILNIIPNDPSAHYFVLTDDLRQYSRVKGKGLPSRYRLFFKVFKDKSAIVILWLGYPRRQGCRGDCYEVFKKKVFRGEFPLSFDDLLAISKEFDVKLLDNPPSLEL